MDGFAFEFVEPFNICFKLLGNSHIDFFENNTTVCKKLMSFSFVVCAAVYHISLLTYTSKVFWREIEFSELPYIVPVLMVATHGILKAAIVIPKKPQIRALILQLGSLWRTDNLTEVQTKMKYDCLKRLNICHSVFYWLNIVGTWQYMLVPLFETLFRRFILHEQSDLLFPFACSFPFDPVKTWTRYVVVYIFEIFSMLHLIYIYLGAEFLMITLCAHLSTEFSLLQEDLRSIKPTLNSYSNNDITMEYNNDEKVKYVIKRHQKLIMLSKQLDDIFNKMIFVNLLFASVTICFFGFVAKMSRGPADVANNFVGVFASMLPIFNLCYYGELLTGASVGIAHSAYENLWYNGDMNFKKIIILIILKAQRPCCLTSFKYVPVALNTFTTVLSTTWSYFSLTTTMYEEK